LAATSTVVGVIWDISWHRTIGRDTFWTPAHMAIYLGGVLAGCACGFLVLRTTFAGTPEERAAGVRFWGFRGPLGAWVAIWGAFAMITSAPFDNWWHNAYGLDVTVLSPPHVLLALGFTGIQLGALLMALALQNRAAGPPPPALKWMFVYAAGLLVTNVTIMGLNQIAFANDMHNALYYQVAAFGVLLFLVAATRASRLAWPATATAVVYMAVTLAMLWILQLFPATARLAPIYRSITHMVPPPFPMLLVIPALGVDLISRRQRGRVNDWVQALAVGIVFVAVLFAVQWLLAPFLISPHSENFFFGTSRWDYSSRPGPWEHQFWNTEDGILGGKSPVWWLPVTALLGMVAARIGLAWGNWMTRVKR
ncbi:MAG TPA: hypothetical protein VEO93_08325, partial [Gemmatimonadales bacterium]|nr:hypothetical protein [Gemmatimonadales bacterium]